jgi:hypothetical protein
LKCIVRHCLRLSPPRFTVQSVQRPVECPRACSQALAYDTATTGSSERQHRHCLYSHRTFCIITAFFREHIGHGTRTDHRSFWNDTFSPLHKELFCKSRQMALLSPKREQSEKEGEEFGRSWTWISFSCCLRVGGPATNLGPCGR